MVAALGSIDPAILGSRPTCTCIRYLSSLLNCPFSEGCKYLYVHRCVCMSCVECATCAEHTLSYYMHCAFSPKGVATADSVSLMCRRG